ncbi:MAG: hypothetical protein ACE5EB_02605 [Thermodesulfobacteriota bacterium]
MTFKEIFMLWPDAPALSFLLWIFIALVILYLARTPAHKAIEATFNMVARALRLGARSLALTEKRFAKRNREVILASGLEAAEHSIEREFHRVDAVVKKDLSGYPALNRNLGDLIARIDSDYSQCSEVPPEPSSWVAAVQAVAKIRATGDTQVAKILGDIRNNLADQHKDAIEEYRKSSSHRHEILTKMAPCWRELTATLSKVGSTIDGLMERSRAIDRKIEDFERIRAGSDNAVRKLTSSSMTQFVISALVLLIAVGGAAINFNLIALPMSEMVGGGSYIGPYKTSNIAAMVIIMVEAAMGLYLMEALRITNLFPVIGSMNDKMRVRMIFITFAILFILASVEASLAYMRDQIAADMQALRHALAASEMAATSKSWIPTAGQMVMGFILPFALTFIAIPLESFIHSSRTVLGVVVQGFLRALSFILRLAGNIVRGLGGVVIALYDVFVFPALWIEKQVRDKSRGRGLNSTGERIQ